LKLCKLSDVMTQNALSNHYKVGMDMTGGFEDKARRENTRIGGSTGKVS